MQGLKQMWQTDSTDEWGTPDGAQMQNQSTQKVEVGRNYLGGV